MNNASADQSSAAAHGPSMWKYSSPKCAGGRRGRQNHRHRRQIHDGTCGAGKRLGQGRIRNAGGSSSKNLYGIKATAGWKGKVAAAPTTEYAHGVATRKVEKFRAYDSPADSSRDYASLLRNNPRYEKVLASAQEMTGFVQDFRRADYTTEPRYAAKLTTIIKQSSLLDDATVWQLDNR